MRTVEYDTMLDTDGRLDPEPESVDARAYNAGALLGHVSPSQYWADVFWEQREALKAIPVALDRYERVLLARTVLSCDCDGADCPFCVEGVR